MPAALVPSLVPVPAPAASAGRPLPAAPSAPRRTTAYADLRDEYVDYWTDMRPRPVWDKPITLGVKAILAGRPRYEAVAADLRVPWWWIGITHHLEGGSGFGTHLHNGDSLAGRTVRHPAGRPAAGAPPFPWEVSAKDALRLKGLHEIRDWSIPHALYQWERWNGMGYRLGGRVTPYLWSGSNLYSRGKYVADGRYDPAAVSKQVGAALLLLRLVAEGHITPPPPITYGPGGAP